MKDAGIQLNNYESSIVCFEGNRTQYSFTGKEAARMAAPYIKQYSDLSCSDVSCSDSFSYIERLAAVAYSDAWDIEAIDE